MRRGLGVFLLWAVSGVPQSGLAQFSAKGRSRETRPTAPTTRAQRSGTPPATQSTSVGEREEVLIERYRGLIISQPGEEVPIKRLAELVRKRDGNLEQLLDQLRNETEKATQRYSYLVARGALLSEDGRGQEATSLLEEATQVEPARPEAWLLKGRLEEQLSRKQDARASFEKAVVSLSGPERSLVLRRLRDLCLDMGDYESATAYHKKLTLTAHGNTFVRGELGRELLRRGQVKRAVSELQAVAQASGGDARATVPAYLDWGRALIAAENFPEAIKVLERASRLAINQPGLRREIDETLAEAHRSEGTLKEFIAALANGSSSAPRLELLGKLYEEEGQTDEAIRVYKKALSLAPQNADIRLRLIRLYELTGDLDAATSALSRLAQAEPNDLHLSIRYMDLLLVQGRRQEALRAWDRLRPAAQRDQEAALLLVDFAERIGDEKRQRKLLQELSTQKHGDARYLVDLGSRFYRLGEEEQAMRIWNRIVEHSPKRSQSWVTYGETLIDHEAVAQGVVALEKARDLAPQSAQVRRSLALGLERAATQSQRSQKAQYEKTAIEQWQALLAIPDDGATDRAMARRRIVRIYKRRGQLSAELRRLNSAVEKNNNDPELVYLLSEGYLAAQNPDAAVHGLRRWLQTRKGDVTALLLLERAHNMSGNTQGVIDTLDALVAAHPVQARAYYERMAQAATKQRDFVSALKYAERAVQRQPSDATASAQLADLYLSLGQIEKAEHAYRTALEKAPDNHAVAMQLADLLAQTGRTEEALRLLSQTIRSSAEPALIKRATRRALSLSIPTGHAQDLENTLRPLALGSRHSAVYRDLLLETLGAQFYPLRQVETFGDAVAADQARRELEEMAERSFKPLLTALAEGTPSIRKISLDVLAYAQSPGAASALLSFAASSPDQAGRIRAVLATGSHAHPQLHDQLTDFVFSENGVRQGELAVAAVWAIARQSSPHKTETLLRVLENGNGDMLAYAAWGLADDDQLQGRTLTRVEDTLLRLLSRKSAGDIPRAAAALSLGKLRHRSLERNAQQNPGEQQLALRLLASEGVGLSARAALRAMASTPPTPENQGVIATALLSEDQTVRDAATVAAVGMTMGSGLLFEGSLLPSSLDPGQLRAEPHLVESLNSPSPSSLAVGDRQKTLWAFREVISLQASLALRASTRSAAACLAQLSRATSQSGGFFVLFSVPRDDQEEFRAAEANDPIEQIRSRLVPDLVRLAQAADDRLALLSLSLLRLDDGPSAAEVLETALASEDDERFRSALMGLSQAPTAGSIESIAATPMPEESWSRRRRRVLALEQVVASTKKQAVRQAALAAVSRFSHDENALVRSAALQVLRTNQQ